jgi:hypothetical protein
MTFSTASCSMAGPNFFSMTAFGTRPCRKPGSRTRFDSRWTASIFSRSTRAAGTVMVRRLAHAAGFSTLTFSSAASVAMPGFPLELHAKGGTRTPTGAPTRS